MLSNVGFLERSINSLCSPVSEGYQFHLERHGTCFIDYSSTFSTVITSMLTSILHQLGLIYANGS